MRFEPLIAADAVLLMDDEVARGRLAASAMNSSRLRRRRGARASRSPKMSCSPSTTRLSVAKPCSSGRIARPTAERGSLRARRHSRPAQIGEAALAQHRGEPVGGTGAIGGNRGALAGFALGVEIVAHRLEQLDLRVGPLGGEILRRPRAGIVGCGGRRPARRTAKAGSPSARSIPACHSSSPMNICSGLTGR
jgi:hypothetical protein